MSSVKRLIYEIHRRTLWQVLGIYTAGSWLALQVVGVLAQNFGLPEWFQTFALGLLMIGLPIVLGAAFVYQKLVHEIHRRSLWQVLGIYAVASWLALQVVDVLAQNFGLPEWFPAFALSLLVIGLPIVVTTAFVQEGVGRRFTSAPPEHKSAGTESPGSEAASAAGPANLASGTGSLDLSSSHPSGLGRVLTWRNALVGCVGSFAILGGVTLGTVILGSMGIGPMATLVARGLLEAQGRIVVSEFESVTGDTALAQAVTEALRVDLGQSSVVTVVDARFVASALERMEREPDDRLDRRLASELATREGIEAIVAGEINAVGRGFVFTVDLIAANTGQVLTSHRETARDTSAVIEAIDRLSRALRERIGESLRSMRGDPPLARVTTGSLQALRKYSQAVRAIELEGNPHRGIALLEETVAADPRFAMAWRKMGVEKLRFGWPTSEWSEALKRAFESRDRLTERERYLTIATYHGFVTRDEQEAIRAYGNMLDLDPDDYYALDNLADIHAERGDFERAEPLRLRAVQVYPSYLFFRSLISTQVALGKFEEAEVTLQSYEAAYPAHPDPLERRALLAAARGEYEDAEAWILLRRQRFRNRPGMRARTSFQLAQLAALRGKLAEDEARLKDFAIELAEDGRADAALEQALLLSDRDRWIRRDPERGLRRLEDALVRLPLAQLPLEDRPYLRLAEHYALAGRADHARQLIAEFQAIAPDIREGSDDFMHLILAHVATGEGRHVDALAEALRWEGGECLGRCSDLALAYDRAGQRDSAIAIYERYLTSPRIGIPPPHRWGPFLERLAQLYDERGDRDKAGDHYAKFVELWAEADEELQPRVQAARRRLEEILAARAARPPPVQAGR